jgi:hypothetical protein
MNPLHLLSPHGISGMAKPLRRNRIPDLVS